MKLNIRKSFERGHANHDWLDSHHTFSFGDYHDPAHMGFRSLRVINQDLIAPGEGFPPHPHHDMEIFSYVLEGALEHKDSMGNGRRLGPGDIQLMSAGSGVMHSEYNPSRVETARFLQVWIKPHTLGLEPSYTEWHPSPDSENKRKLLVISADGRDGSAVIHQDADVWRVRLHAGDSVSHEVMPGRGVWFQLIKGSVAINGTEVVTGDGASTEDAGTVEFTATEDAEALLFDLR